jgi:ERCC4-related helicase/ERCC4-type nuclease
MIKDFKPRLYQETILSAASERNTLVVLPTGMGKTNIFLMLAAQRLRLYPDSKIMLLGPTRPLIEQYYAVFKKNFEIDEARMAVFTGQVKPEKRSEMWKDAKIVFSTPQGLENDIISGRIDLKDVSLLGFDEAHKATGDYAYVWIAQQYSKLAKAPRIIAMTASPGSDKEKITEICKNLFIEGIEVRTEEDPDVKPYVQQVDVNWEEVELPAEFLEVRKYLIDCLNTKLKELSEKGLIEAGRIKYMSRREILGLQASLQARVASGERDFEILRGMSLTAEAMKIQHALELLESQGISALWKYLSSLYEQSKTTKTKAVINLVRDVNFRGAYIKTERLHENNIEHPKMARLREIVRYELDKSEKMKLIVFAQYRDSALAIVDELKSIEGIRPRIFVGQMKKVDSGMSQKEQKEAIERFAVGEFNVLVATQIGEEGLDIPSVDAVVFYEPTPSAIRHIQRKGRTGRLEKGEVIILMAKGTRDEAYKWSSHHKQKRMFRVLTEMKKDIGFLASEEKSNAKKEEGLSKYFSKNEKVIIFADYREKDSGVIKELIEQGVNMRLEMLESADYILSEDVGVELKRVPDFVNSLIDGRLLAQLKVLKESFPKPIVIVEGTEDIYSVRNVHPNAIRGLMSTIAVSYSIPILFSRNPKETASYLAIIARHEQIDANKDVFMHSSKKPMTQKELQEYIVSALPGVGATLARPLLKRFGSVGGVVNAKEEELREVEMIGEKKAKKIRDAIEGKYEV